MAQNYVPTPEEVRQLMQQAGGLNLAGQSMAGPVATGQAYAQEIAGGMPMEQVIAPGVSYSPEMAGGYTQKDLDMIAAGPAPVMPIAPTTGDVATIDDQMEFAPVGTPEPTRFSIGDTLFPNVDYLQGLDFSGLPGLGNIDVDAIIKEYQDRQDAGEPEPFESFFTDFSPVTTPSVVPTMPELPDFSNIPSVDESVATSFMPGSSMGGGVATDRESLIGKTLFGQTITPESFGSGPMKEGSFLGGVARPDLPVPEFSFGGKPAPTPFVPEIQNIPMNFTGLPQMPVIPNIPVMPELPIVQQPIQPMNFTRLSNLPVSNFVQPSVEEIVSPISRSRTLPQTPRGLFSL
jgi:hypothetical protein